MLTFFLIKVYNLKIVLFFFSEIFKSRKKFIIWERIIIFLFQFYNSIQKYVFLPRIT
jgi:hypothetical protein